MYYFAVFWPIVTATDARSKYRYGRPQYRYIDCALIRHLVYKNCTFVRFTSAGSCLVYCVLALILIQGYYILLPQVARNGMAPKFPPVSTFGSWRHESGSQIQRLFSLCAPVVSRVRNLLKLSVPSEKLILICNSMFWTF